MRNLFLITTKLIDNDDDFFFNKDDINLENINIKNRTKGLDDILNFTVPEKTIVKFKDEFIFGCGCLNEEDKQYENHVNNFIAKLLLNISYNTKQDLNQFNNIYLVIHHKDISPNSWYKNRFLNSDEIDTFFENNLILEESNVDRNRIKIISFTHNEGKVLYFLSFYKKYLGGFRNNYLGREQALLELFKKYNKH